MYWLVADTMYYWFHRLSHRIPWIKSSTHHVHHDAFHLVPLDVLFVHPLEHIMNHMVINVFPLLLAPVSGTEYLVAVVALFLHSIYLHWDTGLPCPVPLFVSSDYHRRHHQVGRGNYSFLTVWDDAMGTHLPKTDSNKKAEKKRKAKKQHKLKKSKGKDGGKQLRDQVLS